MEQGFDFPALTGAEWRAVAGEAAAERLRYDGLRVPVWLDSNDPRAAAHPLPARPVPVGAGGWEIEQSFSDAASLASGLGHGVEGLRIPAAAQRDPGIARLLEGVHLPMVAVHLDGGGEPGALLDFMDLVGDSDAAALVGTCSRCAMRSDADAQRLALHVAAWAAVLPRFRTWGCDALPWIEGGMSTVDALAGVVRAASDAFVGLEQAGIAPRSAAERAVVRWAVDTDVLHEAAALRALRILWDELLGQHGVAGIPLRIEVRPSMRRWTQMRPEDNLLRVVASTYAAVLGQADGIEALPSTARSEVPAEGPLRWARNIQHLLREECGLHRVEDPVAGSRAVEARVGQLLDAVRAEVAAEPMWAGYVARKGHREALLRGREALLQAPLFLPVDVPRGSEMVPDEPLDGAGGPVPLWIADCAKPAKSAP